MFDIDLGNIFLKRNAESRSISAENMTGEKGGGAKTTLESTPNSGSTHAARDLGTGYKILPCIHMDPGQTVTLMDNEGSGVIRHIWITLDQKSYRKAILRIYWDGQKNPSVECPIGDFFCCSWNARQKILALPINVNPAGGMNSYFPMPFTKHVRITVQNDSPQLLGGFFYTINYTLEPVPPDALFFHAQFRRTNPVPYKADYTMVDGVRGHGQYVGTFMSWQQNSHGWWGEGEIKMFLDGDEKYPTICGTGTEDYFGGAWCFGENYSAPFLGHQDITAVEPNGKPHRPGNRITLYRFHMHDPVFFKQDLRVTMQCLGWRSEGRYLALQDDVSSVVYWYQTLPHAPFPVLPDRDGREII